jgi:RNA polymerase subunit RPABC4/transcription elongation factor Spt4
MATCTHCSAELAPTYKFCIRCGTPVVRNWSTIIEVDATAPAERVPGAIRPPVDVESGPAPVTLFTWSLIGILTAIAIAGIVLALVTR